MPLQEAIHATVFLIKNRTKGTLCEAGGQTSPALIWNNRKKLHTCGTAHTEKGLAAFPLLITQGRSSRLVLNWSNSLPYSVLNSETMKNTQHIVEEHVVEGPKRNTIKSVRYSIPEAFANTRIGDLSNCEN